MTYKNQMLVITITALLIGILSGLAFEDPFFDALFGGFGMYLFFVSFVVLLILAPLYYSKESVYITWRKFAIVCGVLFIILLLPSIIFLSPQLPMIWSGNVVFEFIATFGGYGALLLIPAFLIGSYVLIGVKSWKLRRLA